MIQAIPIPPISGGGAGVGGAANLTTAGAVPYVSSAGVLSQDATVFFWDATNNRLGIGNAAPASAIDTSGLRVYDPTAVTGSTLAAIRAGAGQSGAIQEWQNNAGTALAIMSALGDLSAHSLIAIGTSPAVSSGTIVTGSRNAAGAVTSATTGAFTCTITFSGTVAPVGWIVIPTNLTTANLIRQTAYNTTTATISGTTVTGDVVGWIAVAF